MRVDHEILHREPFRSIVEHTLEMANAIAEATGHRGLTRICITPEIGLALGALPGQSIEIMTAVGKVELYIDDAPGEERCPWCGTAVSPGALLGNTLANGAVPKLAEQAMIATRLYTDELGALRKRVAELEEQHRERDAAAMERETGLRED